MAARGGAEGCRGGLRTSAALVAGDATRPSPPVARAVILAKYLAPTLYWALVDNDDD